MKTGNIIFFVLGWAAGGTAVYLYLNKRYEERLAKDLASRDRSFKKKVVQAWENTPTPTEEYPMGYPDLEGARCESDVLNDQIDIMAYAQKLRGFNYTGKNTPIASDKDEADVDKPYIISPDEYGEDHSYEQVELTYYADGVLAYDNDDIMENADERIGLSSLNHFGEYEEDSVYVRNEILRCEYQICRDERTYSDVTGRELED